MSAMLKPSWILTVPEGEYHAASRRGDFLSSHLLGDFRTNPALYAGKMNGDFAQPETEAMLFGRMVHKLILEGREAFDREYQVSDGPTNPKTGETYGKATKAYQEWARAQVMPVCSTKDFAFISALERSVRLHLNAHVILHEGFAEGVARAMWCGENCQIRMDWFDPARHLLADLKTCDTLDYFERDAKRFGYIHQLAFYRDVANAAAEAERSSAIGTAGDDDAAGHDGPAPQEEGEEAIEDAYIVAVEKREPYRCGVWKIAREALDDASEENRQAIDLMQECRAMGEWPTYFEDVRELDFVRKED